MTAVIEVDGLRKDYRRRRGGRVQALDGLDLSVPAGGVFGFLGPNGSGKTTTIRCLLGLARPTAGRCQVLGADSPAGLPAVIGRVGALVEAPGINPGLSGRQALTILATTAGIGRARVDAVLDFVGGAGTLARAGLAAHVDGGHLVVDVVPDRAESITRALVADGHYPTELRPVETSLEDAFFALTDAPSDYPS